MIYHSWEFSRRVSALGARGVRSALRPHPRRIANFLYPGELNGAFTFAQEVTELLPAMSFPMGSSALASRRRLSCCARTGWTRSSAHPRRGRGC